MSNEARPATVEVVQLNRAGVFRRAGCQADRVHDRAQALQRLFEDKAAWVKPEDVTAVLEAYRAAVTHAATLPAWAAEFGPAGVQP